MPYSKRWTAITGKANWIAAGKKFIMRIVETAEDALFRAEVRHWLEDHVIRGPRPHQTGEAQRAFDLAWRRRQFDGGWGHIAWPEEYGGRGISLARQLIWY